MRPQSLDIAPRAATLSRRRWERSVASFGLGLTRVLSYQVAAALRDGKLVRVLVAEESPAAPVNLIYPGQGRLPMKTRAFINFALGRLHDRLSALNAASVRERSLPATPVQRRRRRLQR
jgi:DNA-binding transcriptional LysR family regulator